MNAIIARLPIGNINAIKKLHTVIIALTLTAVFPGFPAFADNLPGSLSVLLTEGADAGWRDSVVMASLSDPRIQGASIGIYIEDIRTGEVLADVNGDIPVIPASVTKSITTATVLSLHDPSERFHTDVVLIGTRSADSFKGDLEIRTVGDPTIESTFFPDHLGFADSIASAVAELGINVIEGVVRVNDSLLPDEILPAGWLDRDVTHPYGAGHHSANFADNTLVLRMPTGTITPATPGVKIIRGPKKGKLRIDRKRDTNEVKVSGNTPRRGSSIEMSNPDPSSTMIEAVSRSLKDKGIIMRSPASNRKVGGEELIVYTHDSPSVLEICHSLMHRSDNMMAEAMLRFIAPGASRNEALKTQSEYWSSRSVDFHGVEIEDGSGLSRNNRVTPYFLADIYYQLATDMNRRNDYVSLFPKAGMEGTMKSVFANTRLEGRLAMKTGTVNGVRALAGYLLDGDLTPSHVVVVIVNDFKCSRMSLKQWTEELLLKILP